MKGLIENQYIGKQEPKRSGRAYCYSGNINYVDNKELIYCDRNPTIDNNGLVIENQYTQNQEFNRPGRGYRPHHRNHVDTMGSLLSDGMDPKKEGRTG